MVRAMLRWTDFNMLAHYAHGFKSDKLEAQGAVLEAGQIGSWERVSEGFVVRELVYNDELTALKWALNSAVECHLHTVEVIGSNPIAPTIFSAGYRPSLPFYLPFRASIATLPLAARMSAVAASP